MKSWETKMQRRTPARFSYVRTCEREAKRARSAKKNQIRAFLFLCCNTLETRLQSPKLLSRRKSRSLSKMHVKYKKLLFIHGFIFSMLILKIVAHMAQTLRERDRRGNTIGRPVLDVLYQLSCSACPDILVLAVLLCLFRAAYPVLAHSFCPSFFWPPFFSSALFFKRPFFWPPRSGRRVPAAPFRPPRSGCPVPAAPFRLPRSGCPHSGCPLPAAPFRLPRSGCPVPAAPSLSSLLKLHRRYLVPRLLTQDGE
jgi:hypothetical protein